MATLSKSVGYECEFVDQVPEDYFCKQCKHVAREPHITSCCGETFCKACINTFVQEQKECPTCEECGYSSVPQRKYQTKIQALRSCCTKKNSGCQWTGQLQHLDAHLDVTAGDCEYTNVDCPNNCSQKIQKRRLHTHLAEKCPNRYYICPHCSLRNTFKVVTEHFEVCPYYPLVCPNRCGATFERDDLEDHTKLCGLVKVQCDFSYAGCQAEFLRDKREKHLEQNTQKHLTLMAAATLNISQEQQQMLKQKLEEQKEVFTKQLSEKLQEKDVQIKTLEEQLQIKDRQFQQQRSMINNISMEVGIPPYEITFSNFQEEKAKVGYTDSPPMYTHPGGYRFKLRLWPDGLLGGDGTHVLVAIYSLKAVHDAALKFPANFNITVQLLNQHNDQDHHTRNIQCTIESRDEVGSGLCSIGTDSKFIPHAALEWNCNKQTQYLKDNCLTFIITKIWFQ